MITTLVKLVLKNIFFSGLGATSIFMLPQIMLNRYYEWVGGFLCELVNIILWQFDN